MTKSCPCGPPGRLETFEFSHRFSFLDYLRISSFPNVFNVFGPVSDKPLPNILGPLRPARKCIRFEPEAEASMENYGAQMGNLRSRDFVVPTVISIWSPGDPTIIQEMCAKDTHTNYPRIITSMCNMYWLFCIHKMHSI